MATLRLTDPEIARFLAERKTLPANFRELTQTKSKRGHKERDLDVSGDDGSEFRVILRHSLFNVLDFSVILVYRPANTNQLFRLRRYNGRSHEHTNILERQTFFDFHIHTATERYQDAGMWEDSYAEASDRFADFHTAIDCMLEDCGFKMPPEYQRSLYS